MKRRFGRYEVVSKLGEGAMAAVHLARDPVLTRPVAVKVLHGTVAVSAIALKRFFNEAKTIANVRSPYVVEVFDFGREGRDYYLVMEFVDGMSLKGVLAQLGRGAGEGGGDPGGEPLPEDFTAALVCQAAEGLDMAARMGVVHRDIKPENLMLNTHGYLKIADFGIAHLQDDSLTRTGAVLGSPLYMSPEQVRGAKPITSQSDMFSLGAVLYRCLAGRPPFASGNLKELYRQIAREPHPPLARLRPGVDPTLAALVDRLLGKDPAARGEGPRWLRGALRAWLMDRGVADPMELVASHLEALARRGLRTTWVDADVRASLPRTVVATLPRTALSTGSPRMAAETVPFALPERMPARPRPWRRAVLAGLVTAPLLGAAGYGLRAAWSDWRGRPDVAGTAGSPERGAVPSRADRNNPDEALSARGQGSGADDSRGPHGQEGGFVAKGSGKGRGSREATAGDRAVPTGAPGAEADAAGQPAAGMASLRVLSSPPFAELFLDGRSLGVTPLDLAAVAAGPHRLSLKAPGGASLDTVLDLAPGRRTLRFRLETRAVALDAEE